MRMLPSSSIELLVGRGLEESDREDGGLEIQPSSSIKLLVNRWLGEFNGGDGGLEM